MPGTLRRALETVRRDGSFSDLARVVGRDAGLAGTLLRYANGFDAVQPVEGVRAALVRIGMQGAREALLIASSRSIMRVPGRRRLTRTLQTRSGAVAAAASAIVAVAPRSGMPTEDEALTAGVMHDVGRAAVHSLLRAGRGRFPKLLGSSCNWDPVVDAIHQEVGWELAVAWKLSVPIAAAIGHHHCVETAPGDGAATRIVAAACAFADHLRFASEAPCARPREHPAVIPFRLDAVEVAEIIRRVRVRMNRAAGIA
jgi:HD-like signal output (HDOD) protein